MHALGPRIRGLATAVVVTVALAGCGDDEPGSETSGDGPATDLLPTGGDAPPTQIEQLGRAALAAGCRLGSTKVLSRDHTADQNETVRYTTEPPNSGRHFQLPAQDGAYYEAPPDSSVVHAFEHGRVGIWYSPDLPQRRRAQLRALLEEDSYQQLLVPRAGKPYEVAASAWNRDPEPLGTGRFLVCERLNDRTFDALRAFRNEHRGQGPEPIP